MLTLKRPYAGRLITGVGIGFAERYGVPVLLVRIFLIAAAVVFPITLLLYLILSVSIPDERRVASELRLRMPAPERPHGEQFEYVATALAQRLTPRSERAVANTSVAIILFVLAALMELPRMEGSDFYWSHPILTSFSAQVLWLAPLVLFLSVASLLVSVWRPKTAFDWEVSPRERYAADDSSTRMLGGVASGVSRTLRVDAAYIRAIWIVLNFLTLGIAGLLYLLLWFLERFRPHQEPQRERPREPLSRADAPATSTPRSTMSFRTATAVLLLLLGMIYIAVQSRLYFFNDQLYEGMALALIGIVVVWRGISMFEKSKQRTTKSGAWLLLGACIFLVGIYLLASTIGQLSLDTINRFEIAEIIAAVGFLYFAFAGLLSQARSVALVCALVFAASAGMIAFHLTPPEYLMGITRFYEFFYPMILAALGIWIIFEP